MKFLLKACLVVSLLAVATCSTAYNKPNVCIDGWTTEGESKSVIATPPTKYYDFLADKLDITAAEIICVHHLPSSSKYIFITKKYRTISVEGQSPNFFYEEGVIVSVS